MKLLASVLAVGLFAQSSAAMSIISRPSWDRAADSQQHIADVSDSSLDYSIPSVYESTVMARRILHLSRTGTLVTTFPDETSPTSNEDHHNVEASENRPSHMGGVPIGLMEYYADCADSSGNYGNPTMLAINIATPYKNYHQGSNISLSIRWWPDQSNTYFTSDIPTPHTPAALPRFSLIGYLEPIDLHSMQGRKTQACFVKQHPDSVLWQPGNDIHESEYVRFVVEHVYWFGGFGDRARIGWLPIEDWRSISMEEVDNIKLPGEKKKADNWWRDWL